MNITIQQVTAMLGARRHGTADGMIRNLLTDSRSLVYPESTLFFALRTRQNDGHRYIDDLYRRGVRHFVVSQLPESIQPDANYLVTHSPLAALQTIGASWRAQYGMPVVGITGSNGKTMVKEWLARVLSSRLSITRSPRSYNSQIGVPLSVSLLDEHTQVGIFEAGISMPGEMGALQAIIRPTLGILTNLGDAHQENFESLQQKCFEKLQLFSTAHALIYPADHPVIASCLSQTRYTFQRVGWSLTNPEAALYATTEQQGDTTRITLHWQGETVTVRLPFLSQAAIENALSVFAAASLLLQQSGLTSTEATGLLQTELERLEPVAMRLETRKGMNGNMLINDSYNSDLKSLDIALDFMQRRFAADGQLSRTLILSDMEQTGRPADELTDQIASLIQARGVGCFVGVGPMLGAAAAKFPAGSRFFATTDELLRSGLLESFHDQAVLIKGASAFRFGRVTAALAGRVHETTLQVNLGALVANLDHYRAYTKPGTRFVCMVKAGAYGAGAVEVAKTLQDHRVDYLAVAVADEGVELRHGGITTGIIVMNPEMAAFDDLFTYHLEPEVYSFQLLKALIRAAERRGLAGFPVHVKLDTGMHRLGFDPRKDIPQLIELFQGQTALVPRSVFSHFAGSDTPALDDFTRQQFALFDQASRRLCDAMKTPVLRHICNTTGIERYPEYHLDMVRLGLGLYGINPLDNQTIHTVSTLRTIILQLRDVPADETVGYGRRGQLERPSRIAAIPIGYADGLNRHLGNRRGYALVGGKPAPYVGNICMDVCMIDVTDIPCQEGDEVIVFGEGLPTAQLSEWLDTIPYEILTGISPRVKRVYYQE